MPVLLLFIITGCSSNNTTLSSDFYGLYCTSDGLSTENCFMFNVITLSNGRSYNINYDNPSGAIISISNSSAFYYKR